MTKLYGVFGAGGYGREVLPLVREQLRASGEPFELAFVDDHPPATHVNGHPCLTYDNFLRSPATSRHMVLAIANGVVRESLALRCKQDDIGFLETKAANIVRMDGVQMGEGAILGPFVTLTSNIVIGRHFHANLYSYVAHDCVLGDFVTFAPAVKCNGNVHIGDHAYIGAGALLRQGRAGTPLRIGRGAVVGMGAVVTRDVPPGATVVGNPARPLEKKG